MPRDRARAGVSGRSIRTLQVVLRYGEVDLEGARVDASGHLQHRETFVGVKHVMGVVVTRKLTTGTIWGWFSSRDCRFPSRRPVRFRAIYVGPNRARAARMRTPTDRDTGRGALDRPVGGVELFGVLPWVRMGSTP